MELVWVDELIEGMVLAKSIISEKNGKIILEAGVKLKDNLIQAIKNKEIRDVYVRDRFTMDFDPLDNVANDMKKRYIEEIMKFAPKMKNAGVSDSTVEASMKAIELIPSIYRNQKILQICFEMKIVDKEFYKHAIATSALAMIISFLKGLDKRETFEIAIAGLFHDIGMMESRALINHKRTTIQEERMWKECPVYGYYMMMEKKFPSSIAAMVKHSRELWNGEGYPENLKEKSIPRGSRIIFLAQMYDELLRYEKIPSYLAVEHIYGGSGFHFDPDIVNIFTGNISIYPLKSMVRLSNGEVGTVVNVRKNEGPRPIIKVYYNSCNKPFKIPKEIDLGIERTIFIKELLD